MFFGGVGMAKVIKNFREKRHNMKRYNVGDDYPDKDKQRVKFLTKLGYLEEPAQQTGFEDPATVEEFEELSAEEQKAILFRFNIQGDDGNKEKRVAMYAA